MRRTLAALTKSKVNWLDVRGASLSVLERLLLEECLLKSDPSNRHWMLVGHHETGPHKYLTTAPSASDDSKPCIVMGIGGKPELLLDLEKVRRDQVMTIKRFTGGGTVVVDPNCLWTTIIGRRVKLTDDESMQDRVPCCNIAQIEPFPRPIMEWTADAIFGPLFRQLNQRQQQDSPEFQLLENDYILLTDDNLQKKMGGNAQAIVREGWLHHTSFLWTYKSMQYLTLPSKRPKYRADRNHSDFLVQLQSEYPSLDKHDFYEALRNVCEDQFDVHESAFDEVLAIVDAAGGMQAIYDKSRTRVLTDL